MINTESEAALIEAFTRGSGEKTPMLGYFYEPQNLRLVMAPHPRGWLNLAG